MLAVGGVHFGIRFLLQDIHRAVASSFTSCHGYGCTLSRELAVNVAMIYSPLPKRIQQ